MLSALQAHTIVDYYFREGWKEQAQRSLRGFVSYWSLRAACEVNMADCPVAAMGNQPWSRNAASKIKDLIFILRNSKLTFALHESLWRVYSCIVLLLLLTKNKKHDTSSLSCIFCVYLQKNFIHYLRPLTFFSHSNAVSLENTTAVVRIKIFERWIR